MRKVLPQGWNPQDQELSPLINEENRYYTLILTSASANIIYEHQTENHKLNKDHVKNWS